MKNKKQKTPKLPKYEYGNMHENMHTDQQTGTQNIYNQGRSSKINAGQIGQYAGYAAVAGQTAGNLADINNQDYNGDTKAYAQSQAIGNGLTQSGAAFSPLIGMGTGLRKSATAMVGDQSGANRTASNWMAAPHEAASSDLSAANNSNNSQSQKIGGYMSAIGDITGMSKMRQMFSYGTGNDEKTTGFWGKYNDLTGISARNNQKNSLEQNQFAGGGEVPREFANSEVEKEENAITPDGEFLQFSGKSHEMGGIPTQLDPGTLIFSDKLKLGKKTFAQLNKVNNTNKEDKVLDNPNADRISKKTAELLRMAKLKNSEMLFRQQEDLKQAKVQAYAKRMGVNLDNEQSESEMKYGGIQKYPFGGEITPQQYKQAQVDSMTLYKSGLNPKIENYQYLGYNDAYLRLNDINGQPPSSINNTATFQGKEYTGATSQFAKPSMIPYNSNSFNKISQTPLQQTVPTPTYHPNYNQPISGVPKSNYKFRNGGKKDPNDINALNSRQQRDYQAWFNANSQNEGFNPDDYSVDNYMKQYESRGAELPTNTNNAAENSSQGSNFDWGKLGTQVGLGIANNAGNIYDLSRSSKPEVTKFQRANANLLDPTAALRDATDQTRRAEYNVRGASSGNAGTYLSNRVALNAQNIVNKDRIRQEYANANAGILNQNSQFNTGIANQEYVANEQNRAQTRNIKGQALANIGSNTVSQYRDNKSQQYDQTTLDNMSEFYNALKNDPYAKARWEKIKKGYK